MKKLWFASLLTLPTQVGFGGYKDEMIKKFGHSNFLFDAAQSVKEQRKELTFTIPEPVLISSYVIDIRVCPQDADINTCRLGKQCYIREGDPLPEQTPRRRLDRQVSGILRVYSGDLLKIERFITKEMEETLETQKLGAEHLRQLAYKAAQNVLSDMLDDPEKGIPFEHKFGDERDAQARRRHEEIQAQVQRPKKDTSMPQGSERLPPLIETQEFNMDDQRKFCMDIIESKKELVVIYDLDPEDEKVKNAIEFLAQQYDESKCNKIL